MTFNYFKKHDTFDKKASVYLIGFPSFYKFSKIKILSKKQSFYQYLFIHSFFGKTLNNYQFGKKNNFSNFKIENNIDIDIKWENLAHPLKQKFNKTYYDLTSPKNKSSFLVEKLTNLHNINLRTRPSIGNENLTNKKRGSFYKIFITYKKSFLSYWLLPLLGFTFSINPILKSNKIDYLSPNYSTNSTKTNLFTPKLSNFSKEMDSIFLSTTKQTNVSQKSQKYSKSLFLTALKYYQKNNLIESLLLEKEIKNFFLNMDFRTMNYLILEKEIKNKSKFNWLWFHLNSDLSTSNQNNTNYIFPDKISQAMTNQSNFDSKRVYNLLKEKKNLNNLRSFPRVTNFFNILQTQNLFKLNPIEMLLEKNHHKMFENQSFSLSNYLIGIKPNSIHYPNLDKTVFKDSNLPLNSIHKSYFLIDQLYSNQPRLFYSILSYSDFFNVSELENNSLRDLKSNREKTLISILNNKFTSFQKLKEYDLNSINSKMNNKKLIFSINSDVLYDSIFNGLKETLNLTTNLKQNLLELDNKNQQIKNSLLIQPDLQSSLKNAYLTNFKIKNKKTNFATSVVPKKWNTKFKPIFSYSCMNLSKFIKYKKDIKIPLSFSENNPTNNLSNYKWNEPKMSLDSKNQFEFLIKNSLKLSSDLNPGVMIQKNSINAGKFLPIQTERKILKFNSKKSTMISESLFKTDAKQKVFTKTKTLMPLSKSTMESKDILKNVNNSNYFLNTSNYLLNLTKQIKKGLNPYKFRLSYLSEINLINSKNLKKLQFQRLNRNNQKPNFEKVFLAYLSKSKKSSYNLKSSETKYLNSFKPELKNNTIQKLKTLNNRYLKVKEDKYNQEINFDVLNKNNSSLMILKNRLFMNKNVKQNSDLFKTNELIYQNEDKSYSPGTLKLRQELKIKRRLKKMKCETRRRKKRKIFYPRPSWIVFSLYKKFLDSRYPVYSAKSDRNLKKDFGKQNYSHWLKNNAYCLNNSLFQKPMILTNSNNFYQISKTVLSDLRRVLMKSNWLRSYLNPYFEKVKIIYKDLQKSSKKVDNYNYFKKILGFIYGFPANFTNDIYLNHRENVENNVYLNLRNSFYESQNYQSLNALFNNKIFYLNRAERINILEYNRIIYQRIQRAILNIRENLNLNGEIKNRSKKVPKNIRPFIKRDYIKREMINGVPTNQNNGFWSKIFKSNVLKFGRSFIHYNYDEIVSYRNLYEPFSRNNFYWAISKTSTLNSINFNSSFTKKLWESSKIREISKSNKTKKIMFNLFMKYNNFFNSPPSLNGFDHILEIFKNDPNFINSQEFETSRFTKFFYKKNILSKDPILSYTNYSLDDEINPTALTLSAKTYIIKTEQKLSNIENKLKLLGLYSKKIEQNYKNSYFRFLKQELMKEKIFFYSSKNQKFEAIFSHLKEKSFNPITNEKFFKTNSSSLKNRMGNYYWWNPLPSNFDALNKNQEENFQKFSGIGLVSFSFHFCALISFISLGGIRTLLKFYYILISKISKLIASIENVENLLPKNSIQNSYTFENIINMDESFVNKKIKGNETYINQKATKTIINKKIKRSKLVSKEKNLMDKKEMDLMHNLKLNFLNYLTLRKTTKDKLDLHLTHLNSIPNAQNKPYKLNLKIKNQTFISEIKDFKTLGSSKEQDFYFIFKYFNLLLPFIFNSSKRNQKSNKFDLKSDVFTENSLRLQYSSIVKASVLSKFIYKSSFYIYLLILRSIDVLSIPASFIYKFFEKPGEYVVENLAYSFLVEWAADTQSTIPDIIDTNSYVYFLKLNRMVSSMIVFNHNFIGNLFNKSFNNSFSFNANFVNLFLLPITNSVMKRVLNSSFLNIIQQLCEPDLDSINRSKKAQSVWDIWGEHLKIIAEQNAINIYELTTDKEEQINLLSKYESSLSNFSSKRKVRNNFFEQSLLKNHINFNKNLSSMNTNSSSINDNKIKSLSHKLIKKDSKQIINLISKKFKNLNSIQTINRLNKFVLSNKKSNYNFNGWSVNQFLSYQGKDSDLFIDLHPPKTFASSSTGLKYSFSAQQPIGLMVCQIFSGIFYKQISKNVLVVGSEGIEKSLLIQAIAGETELKIITDSAHRYAMVHRGIAVGIKLLKDVFEALSMHTPCIFLMEDIHVIGERRPFLIDEGSSNSVESPYNKNQSMQGLLLNEKNSASREGLYKNNKHLLSYYKKPYKEIKGLATNHFCFTFLFGDLFSKSRLNEINQYSNLRSQVIKKQSGSNFNLIRENDSSSKKVVSSLLELQQSMNESLLTPTSSPFNILVSKETSKLKHKKIVKQMPWFGLPGEQLSLVSKYNYSIRVKVALLADLILSNLSVKLDMITDLLVIIDSVKSNHGFAVFATTHIPYILDPALRRPGRFDETISLPLIPGLSSRWTNYKSNVHYLRNQLCNQYSIPFNNLLNKGIPLDLTKYMTYNQQFPMNKLINHIIKSKNPIIQTDPLTQLNFKSKNFTYLKALLDSNYSQNNKKIKSWNLYSNSSLKSPIIRSKNYSHSLSNFKDSKSKNFKTMKNQNNSFLTKNIFNRNIIQVRSKNYSYACKSLLSLFIYKYKNKKELKSNPLDSSLKWPNLIKDWNQSMENSWIYLNLFTSDKVMFSLILISLIGVKVGEDGFNSFNLRESFIQTKKPNRILGSFQFNFDKTWKYGSSILFNYIQKRQCSSLTKNLAFCSSRLISFNNKYSLMEPPGPPISNILLPAKRYENYKRSFNNQYLFEQNNFEGSISEKLQFHQQQRLLKRLYKYPIKQFFRSHLLKKDQNMQNFSNFNNSFLTLEKINSNSMNNASSINWCYKNILYNRHKTYLTNQWWNGLQGEHNAESTFLSHIDWRYTFIESLGDIQIDFPDAEQYYNPKNRRWILTKGNWDYWFNFKSEMKTIYSHYLYESFSSAYKYLDKNREMIDFYVELLHQSSLGDNLKDHHLLNLYKRFVF